MNDSDAARMVYPVYTLQDSVPFESSQNAETDATNAESTNAIPAYEPLAASAPYPYAGLSGIVPYANGNIGGGYNPGAFAVQSGYEGYIVPGPPELAQPKAVVSSNLELPFVGAISSTLTPLANALPVSMRSVAAQAITVITALLGFTVLGGGLTTAICTLTPFCTISFALPFALPFARSGLKAIAKPFVGEENAELLENTLMRLSKMQRKEQDELAAKTADNHDSAVDTTKSVDGADVTADVARTIAKLAEVTKAAAAAAATAPLPTTKTETMEKSNDQ